MVCCKCKVHRTGQTAVPVPVRVGRFEVSVFRIQEAVRGIGCKLVVQLLAADQCNGRQSLGMAYGLV